MLLDVVWIIVVVSNKVQGKDGVSFKLRRMGDLEAYNEGVHQRVTNHKVTPGGGFGGGRQASEFIVLSAPCAGNGPNICPMVLLE
jgi:hypothetical protein